MLKYVIKNVTLSRKIFKSLKTGIRIMSSAGVECVENVVCKDSDIPENGMKEFPLNGGKVLVVKQNGQIYAVGTKCNHYGAPLIKGDLGNGRIRCPWHGACFDLKTGDIEDFPGLDSLPCYQVSVSANGDVKVGANKSLLNANSRQKCMVARNPNARDTFVIVGGGAAGSACAEGLRQEGYNGRIIVISDDSYLPYDRPKVSKILNADINNILLRKREFYQEHGIEMMTKEKVVSINSKDNSVQLKSGKQFNFTKVFVACGARARQPTFIEGFDLQNIFTVRTIDDGHKIFNSLTPDTKLVAIGSSFIAMESAAFAVGKVKNVTVLGRSNVPFENVLGKEIGRRILELYESKGVVMKMNCKVEKFIGTNGKLTHVQADGVQIPADVCVVGLGSQFETDFLHEAGVELTDKGCVDVNEFLQSSNENIYAGGDVAFAPVTGSGGKKDSIGHWQLAQYHGHIAAKNMVGKKEPIKSVPFFFSMLFGNGLRYAGYGHDFDSVQINGDLSNLKYVAYYLKNNEVIASASMAADPIVAKFANHVYDGKILRQDDIVDNKWTL